MSRRLVSLLGILVVIGCMFCLTGCLSKEALTGAEFTEKMEAAGYTVTDITANYDSTYVKAVLIAKDPTDNYQIEFFEQNSVDQAQVSYETNIETMHENQGSTATHFSVNGANYQKETQSSNGQYWVVC